MTDGTKFKHPALPHSSPPLVLGVAALKELGEGASPYSSPLYKGGLRGVMQGIQRKSNLCVHRSSPLGEGLRVWGQCGGYLILTSKKSVNLPKSSHRCDGFNLNWRRLDWRREWLLNSWSRWLNNRYNWLGFNIPHHQRIAL
jgi:hypothetical protein